MGGGEVARPPEGSTGARRLPLTADNVEKVGPLPLPHPGGDPQEPVLPPPWQSVSPSEQAGRRQVSDSGAGGSFPVSPPGRREEGGEREVEPRLGYGPHSAASVKVFAGFRLGLGSRVGPSPGTLWVPCRPLRSRRCSRRSDPSWRTGGGSVPRRGAPFPGGEWWGNTSSHSLGASEHTNNDAGRFGGSPLLFAH